jgi:protein-disulfide isomerase
MTAAQGTLRPPVGAADHSAGSPNAPVTLVEYGDFECPHCFRAHPIVVKLQRTLGDKLRFVFRNFPVTQIHEHALEAVQAAESVATHAGEAAYWQMHHAIFEHQQDGPDALDRAHLLGYAQDAGADAAAVERDLAASAFEAKVKSDFMSGARSGVNGTPTFFINGVRFDGNWTSPSELREALLAAASG